MKKKIALLLAAVMTLSAVPTLGLFAAGGFSVIGYGNLPEKTLVPATAPATQGSAPSKYASEKVGGKEVKYVSGASSVDVKFAASATADFGFDLTLTNAEFLFAKVPSELNAGVNTTFPVYDNIAGTAGYELGGYSYTDGGGATVNVPVVDADDDKAYRSLDYKDGTGNVEFSIQVEGDRLAVTVPKAKVVKDVTLNIPISLYIEKSSDVSIAVTYQSVNLLPTTAEKINSVTRAAGATVSIGEVKSGRKDVILDTVKITESVPNILKDGGTVKLTLSSGYEFVNTKSDIKVTTALKNVFTPPTGGTDYDVNVVDVKIIDKTEIYLTLKQFADVSGRAVTIKIDGLKVSPDEDTEDTDYFGTTIKLTVEGASTTYPDPADSNKTITTEKIGVDKKSVEAALFLDYGVKVVFDKNDSKVTEAFSGKKDIKAGVNGDDVAVIKFYELAASTWSAERDLEITLTDADGKVLDGVKFKSFTIEDAENVAVSGSYDAENTSGKVVFKRTKVVVNTGAAVTKDKLGSFKFSVLFNASANFTGDVYVTVGGRAINNEKVPLKVATITAPITVKTVKTNVPVGWQSYNVSGITVTENAAEALAKGKDITFTVKEPTAGTTSRDDVIFNSVDKKAIKVDSGNISIGDATLDGNSIKATINKASTEASKFTLSGLTVKTYRDTPYGTYDLVVGGDSWVETFDPKFGDLKKGDDDKAMFDVEGFVYKGFIDVSTPGDTQTIARNVQVMIGTSTMIVDGKEIDMEIDSFIDTESGRTMIPLRAVAVALGISDDKVIWDGINRTVTIMVGSGTSLRTVTFKIGEAVMTINGAPVPMVDENGTPVAPVITKETGRTFIPFRQLGTAFGIEVDFINGSDRIAVFNPTPEQRELAKTATPAAAAEDEAEATDEAAADETATDEAAE